MPRYDIAKSLAGYEFRELNEVVGTHGDYMFGPKVQVKITLMTPAGADTEAKLVLRLIPGRFEPLGFSCELSAFPGETHEVTWAADSVDPRRPDPPEFLTALALRVTQELALRALGDAYIDAKNQADEAYDVMVHGGFLEV